MIDSIAAALLQLVFGFFVINFHLSLSFTHARAPTDSLLICLAKWTNSHLALIGGHYESWEEAEAETATAVATVAAAFFWLPATKPTTVIETNGMA